MTLFREKELPAAGQPVNAIQLDSGIVLLVGNEWEHKFRIAQSIMVKQKSGNFLVEYDAYAHTPAKFITEFTTIISHTITHAYAHTDGLLVLELDHEDVISLTVKPHPKYEAWEYVHEDLLLMCPPGGRFGPNAG